MSFRMVDPARYTCDGCGVRALGWVDEAPQDWRTLPEILVEELSPGAKIVQPIAHFCPHCAPVRK